MVRREPATHGQLEEMAVTRDWYSLHVVTYAGGHACGS